MAAALITLGTAPGATGQIWHLPVPRARTTRQIIDRRLPARGTPPAPADAGRVTLSVIGMVKPAMREYLHTLYQFTAPWVVDDHKFRATFGAEPTPLGDALATTLAWYRTRAAVRCH